MSFRVVDVSTPVRFNFMTSNLSSSIGQMILELKDMKGTIVVNSGNYNEDITVPDGVSLIGNGIVKINGSITLLGDGMLKSIDVTASISVKGNRVVEKCTTSILNIYKGSYASCFNSHISKINCVEGYVLIRCSTIGSDKNNYAIELRQGMISVENCTIEGSSYLFNESVFDCKNSSVIGNNDLFQTQHETATLQLFNCTVFGEKLIKNGPGKSVRFNLVALSIAKDFEGGENTKIESI